MLPDHWFPVMAVKIIERWKGWVKGEVVAEIRMRRELEGKASQSREDDRAGEEA